MATLSSPSLILLLQTLLFLATTGELLRLTSAAPVIDICLQTKDPSRCVCILLSTDKRALTATLPELEQIAIEAATNSTGENKIKVHSLFLSASDANSKIIYGNCENRYRGALDALLIAPENLQQRQYAKLVTVAGIVRGAVDGCAAAVEKNGELKRGNEDAGLAADVIALIAHDLMSAKYN